MDETDKAQVVKQDDAPEEATPLPPMMLRDSNGHWLPGSRPANMITPAMVPAMLEARKLKAQLRREGAGRGVIAAAAEHEQRPIASEEEAHAVIARVLVAGGLANAMDKPREAWAGVAGGLRMAGQLPADERGPTDVVPIQINFALGGELETYYMRPGSNDDG